LVAEAAALTGSATVEDGEEGEVGFFWPRGVWESPAVAPVAESAGSADPDPLTYGSASSRRISSWINLRPPATVAAVPASKVAICFFIEGSAALSRGDYGSRVFVVGASSIGSTRPTQ
jgi:hypothetical protein